MGSLSDVPVQTFLAKTGDIPREAFVARFPLPFLLVERHAAGDDRGYRTIAMDDTENILGTALAGSTEGEPPVESGAEFVHQLEKTDRNQFHRMISLGRSLNNDIIVSNPAVSKLHAYFKNDRALGGWAVTDAGSTNGTAVGDTPLTPLKPLLLRSGQAVIFGNAVRGTFFLPSDFFDYLDIHRRMGRS